MEVSIVASLYNGEKYIEAQLDSLRKQTRQPDEVLLFDDGSTDNTPQIVREYIKKFKLDNWKYIQNSENKGWRRNFMEGMWSSKGDVVFSCDQDDIWREDKLALMTSIMEKHPEISLLVSNYRMFFEDGNEKVGLYKNDKQLKQVKLKDNYLLVGSPGCTHCIRRELLETAKRYWKPEYAHDALLWRLSLFANGLYIYTDDLIRWRKHENSAFSKESKNLKTIAEKRKWIKVAESFNQLLREYTLTEVIGNRDQQFKVLARNEQWLVERNKFYDTKNPLQGIKLARYWNCFPRYRQYLGDWYLLYIKRR